MILGCDTSHWSGNINFETMYNAGAKFWITKATDAYQTSGVQFEDIKFDTYCRDAFKFGKLLTGCYHWLQGSVDPVVAADFYLERYRRYKFDFPPILDFEEQSVTKAGKQSDFAWRAQVWLERVEAKTGRKPIIYTAKWYTDYFTEKQIGWMKGYPLWVASYPYVWTVLSKPLMPKVWDKWIMWQWSADGNGRGAEFGLQSKSIDLNWFNGDYPDLLAFLGADEPKPIEPIGGGMYKIEMLGNLTIRKTPSGDPTGSYALKGETFYSDVREGVWYQIVRQGVVGWIASGQWTIITEVEPEPELSDKEKLDKLWNAHKELW